VDLIVFGRRSGQHMLRYVKEAEWKMLPADVEGPARATLDRLLGATGDEKVATIRAEMQQCMDDNAGVVRDAEKLRLAQAKLAELRARYGHISIQDKSLTYNSDVTEAWELGNLLDIAESIVLGALGREESRGGHYREDFPKRDDAGFLKHTLITRVDGQLQVGYKPVVITRFQPKERTY
jgi:succinate dehydrogenase / fumarate reductase flavoprotein subunit